MRTSILKYVVLGSVAATGLLAGAEIASAQSCAQLWYQRNAIYAQYGHCFQTQRAISVFGRACFPPYGRLPPDAQAQVNQIIYWERANRCPG